MREPMYLRSFLFLIGAFALAFSRHAVSMSYFPHFLKQETQPITQQEHSEIRALFADKILVRKAERRLYLLKDGKPFLSYPVSLGFEPEGHKERQGDGRTPEGRYVLDWRNAQSRFYKSLHISYPNPGDKLRARHRGDDPGGMIMIHGQPRANRHADLQEVVAKEDWTQGCVAVSNYAIDEIWELTIDGTPIEILP